MAVIIDTLAAAMELLQFHRKQFSETEHVSCKICRMLSKIIIGEM